MEEMSKLDNFNEGLDLIPDQDFGDVKPTKIKKKGDVNTSVNILNSDPQGTKLNKKGQIPNEDLIDGMDLLDSQDSPDQEVELTEKQLIEKQTLILNIYRWKEEFPEYTKHISQYLTWEKLNKLSIPELKQQSMSVKICVSSRKSGKTIEDTFFTLIEITKRLGGVIGFDFEGIEEDINPSNKDLMESLKVVQLEYSQYTYIHPLADLGMNLTNTFMNRHRRNIKLKKNQVKQDETPTLNFLNKKVNVDLITEYEDL